MSPCSLLDLEVFAWKTWKFQGHGFVIFLRNEHTLVDVMGCCLLSFHQSHLNYTELKPNISMKVSVDSMFKPGVASGMTTGARQVV